MTPAEATSSLAPMASALTRTGFVMGTMIARILVMRMAVVRTRGDAYLESYSSLRD
jgi:adenine/guanine phosphoribosyltransferase-like PRPP-binding protein